MAAEPVDTDQAENQERQRAEEKRNLDLGWIAVEPPKGTTCYQSNPDDTQPDIFGVKEMYRKENMYRVRYGSGTDSSTDSMVRMDGLPTEEAINRIGALVQRVGRNQTQYEHIPAIIRPSAALEASLTMQVRRGVSTALSQSDSVSQLIETIMSQMGVLLRELRDSTPKVLNDLLQDLQELQRLGVLYFGSPGYPQWVDGTIQFYNRHLREFGTEDDPLVKASIFRPTSLCPDGPKHSLEVVGD